MKFTLVFIAFSICILSFFTASCMELNEDYVKGEFASFKVQKNHFNINYWLRELNLFFYFYFYFFQEKFDKKYKNNAEERMRMEIFRERLAMVVEHNMKADKGMETYSLAINEYSDISDEELSKMAGSSGKN